MCWHSSIVWYRTGPDCSVKAPCGVFVDVRLVPMTDKPLKPVSMYPSHSILCIHDTAPAASGTTETHIGLPSHE